MNIKRYCSAAGMTGLLAGALIMSFAAPSVAASSVKSFYEHHNITLYIGYTPGGGYDAYSRTIARHMGDHIPGHPDFIAKNLPGAGSMLLANGLYNKLPQDGSVIGMIGRGMPMEKLFGNKAAKYNPEKLNWIGSVNNEVSVCVTWHTTGIDTLKEFESKKITVGGTGPGADTDTFPKVLNNVIGTHLQLVTGYPGGNQINLAMEKGEVQARCGWSWSSVEATRPQWLKNHKVNVVLQMSTSKHPMLTKMGVPWVMDLAKTKRQHKILTLVFARQAMGRPLAAGPKVPASRVAALRTAFNQTMKDPKFVADINKQRLELAPLSGKKVQALVNDIMNTPPEVVEAAKEATEKTTNMYVKTVKFKMKHDTGPVTKIKRGGRRIYIESHGKVVKAKVSGHRTKVTIDGKKVKRSKVKKGMTCEFTYPGPGSEAKKVDCHT